MSLKTILVHMDPSVEAERHLKMAIGLAEQHDAHLVGLAVIAPLSTALYSAAEIPPALFEQFESEQEEAAKKAKKIFNDAVKKAGREGQSEWREEKDRLQDAICLHARYADLVVVGQVDREKAPPGFADLPDDIVMHGGRPVLVAPLIDVKKAPGENVLIAWNGSREASRAVHDALPILEKSKSVEVFTANPKGIGEEPGADIAAHLSRHGVKVNVERMISEEVDVGDALLNRVSDTGADMVVMGAYGHARVRELVLGGATRHILQHMTVPVLMSH